MNRNEKFRLETPDTRHEQAAKNYVMEYFKSNELTDRAVFFNMTAIAAHGSGGLFHYMKNYDGWLEKLESDQSCVADDEKVPNETFFLVRERISHYGAKNILPKEDIVGMANVRLELNDNLWEHNGSIGYNIRPSERGKGYGKIILFLALCVCQKHGLESVLLTCDKTNFASATTMRALEAKLLREKHFPQRQYIAQYYSIDVEHAIAAHEEEYAPLIATWPN